MGMDHEPLTLRYSGRDFRLTNVHGQIIRDILRGREREFRESGTKTHYQDNWSGFLPETRNGAGCLDYEPDWQKIRVNPRVFERMVSNFFC